MPAPATGAPAGSRYQPAPAIGAPAGSRFMTPPMRPQTRAPSTGTAAGGMAAPAMRKMSAPQLRQMGRGSSMRGAKRKGRGAKRKSR
jgi:hypothetical protein